jgi:23S rRNA pseudouridine2605 synthase
MERLQKYMSRCGVASRRKSEDLILEGKVKVNGKVITELGYKINESDLIEVNGKAISEEEKVYFLLYKPEGYITSTKDEKNRRTVLELINTDKKIFPVGRLDYDTSGLLILTNDGEFANGLTHPSGNIEKFYSAKLKGIIKGEEIIKLSKGIKIDGVKTKEAKVKLKRYDKNTNRSYVDITITEGRNHQVKNMFAALGYEVVKLKRKKYAFLTLDGLKKGEYRPLTVKEIKKLYNLM